MVSQLMYQTMSLPVKCQSYGRLLHTPKHSLAFLRLPRCLAISAHSFACTESNSRRPPVSGATLRMIRSCPGI